MKRILLLVALATAGITLAQEKTGVNITAPQATLDVHSDGTDETTKAFRITDGNNKENVTILDNGNVGLGITEPIAKLNIVSGTGVQADYMSNLRSVVFGDVISVFKGTDNSYNPNVFRVFCDDNLTGNGIVTSLNTAIFNEGTSDYAGVIEGGYISAQNTSVGILNNLTALQLTALNAGDGTVKDLYGLRISTRNDGVSTGGGISLNKTGLYIGRVDGATNNNYSIYTNAGLVRFGDLPTSTDNTDKVVVADTNGVLKTQDASSFASANGEWRDGTNTAGENLIYANQAKVAGNDVVVTDEGFIGVGTDNPESPIKVVTQYNGQRKTFKNDFIYEYYDGNTSELGDPITSYHRRAGGTAQSPENIRTGAHIYEMKSDAFVDGAFHTLSLVRSIYKGDGTTTLSDMLFSVSESSSPDIYIKEDHNVGIGTNAPTQKLEVNGNVSVGKYVPQNDNIIGYGNKLIFNGIYGNTDELFIARYNDGLDHSELRIVIADNHNGTNAVDDKFVIGANTARSEGGGFNYMVVVDSHGKMGVGEVEPTEKLEVNGNVKVNGTGAAIVDGAACTNNGTISYGADGNFYGCTGANVWKKLHN